MQHLGVPVLGKCGLERPQAIYRSSLPPSFLICSAISRRVLGGAIVVDLLPEQPHRSPCELLFCLTLIGSCVQPRSLTSKVLVTELQLTCRDLHCHRNDVSAYISWQVVLPMPFHYPWRTHNQSPTAIGTHSSSAAYIDVPIEHSAPHVPACCNLDEGREPLCKCFLYQQEYPLCSQSNSLS